MDNNGFFLFFSLKRKFFGISFLNFDIGMFFIVYSFFCGKIELIVIIVLNNSVVEFVLLVIVVFKLEYFLSLLIFSYVIGF